MFNSFYIFSILLISKPYLIPSILFQQNLSSYTFFIFYKYISRSSHLFEQHIFNWKQFCKLFYSLNATLLENHGVCSESSFKCIFSQCTRDLFLDPAKVYVPVIQRRGLLRFCYLYFLFFSFSFELFLMEINLTVYDCSFVLFFKNFLSSCQFCMYLVLLKFITTYIYKDHFKFPLVH